MIRAWFLVVMVGLSACATGTTEDRLRQVLLDLRQQQGFPGATLAWAGPGGNVRTLAVGMADPDSNTPMTPASRMPAASIGKSFVAAAILSAVEQGQLDLDAPVSTRLGDRPWFSRLPNHETLTLRQLLTHSAGLPDHVYLPAFQAIFQASRTNSTAPDPEELIGLILDVEPLFAPGQGWAYSDTGYLVAALVLESAIGQSWTPYVEARFLEPLALDATSPSNQRELQGLATGITTAENPFDLPERVLDENGHLKWHPGIEGAGGGFASTAADLARWGRALWSGRLHSDDAFEAMLSGVPVGKDRPGVTYGLGVVIEQSEYYGEVRGHRGWVPGYVSSVRYYPDHDLAIALQINSDAGMMNNEANLARIEAAVTDAIITPASWNE